MNDTPLTEAIDILLVEDNPGDARLIKEAFNTSDFNATLHDVRRGDEAIEWLSECNQAESHAYPDLILLDLNLPRVDGFAVLEEVRKSADHAPLPVLVLTSSQATEDIEKSYELAANAYLTKPNTLDEFISLVQGVKEFWFEAARLPPIPS